MTKVQSSKSLVDDYLRSLRVASRRLPRAVRRELLADIESHLRTVEQDSHGREAEIRNAIDALGPPEPIVAEAGSPASGSPTFRDIATIGLLLVGGLAWGVGWLVGIALLWSSPVWSIRQKAAATLVWPGGLVTIGLLLVVPVVTSSPVGPVCPAVNVGSALRNGAVAAHCATHTSGSAVPTAMIALLVIAAALPIAIAVWLYRTAATARGNQLEESATLAFG
jgi:hypothetical protein